VRNSNYGRGALTREFEPWLGNRKLLDKCLPPSNRYRTWLIKYYFIRGVYVKELGEYLKSTREKNGVALLEAADDLKIDSFLLESLEEGNTRAFKDVLKIKDIVKDYAKYLGLNPEKVVDEYNDFLFEHTSKISLEDILDAEKNKDSEEKKVISPYTRIKKRKIDKKKIKVACEFIMLMIIVILLVVLIFRPKEEKIINEIMIRGDLFELTK